jgi:hypothetical protein
MNFPHLSDTRDELLGRARPIRFADEEGFSGGSARWRTKAHEMPKFNTSVAALPFSNCENISPLIAKVTRLRMLSLN